MKPVGASSRPRRAKHSHEAAPIALLVLAIMTLTAGRARAGLSNSAAANTATLPLPASPGADAQSPADTLPPPASEPTDQQGALVMPSAPVALPGAGGNPPNFDSFDNPDIGSYVSQGAPLYSPQIHSLQEVENEVYTRMKVQTCALPFSPEPIAKRFERLRKYNFIPEQFLVVPEKKQ